MKKRFAKSSAPDPAENILRELGCAFERQPDGTLVVAGDIDLSRKNLTRLPDLSSVIVKGSFYCHSNQLTSLGGAPHTVGGNFSCPGNQLTSLKHAPRSVGGSFFCHDNHLTSLEHAPQSVGEDFFCRRGQPTGSWKGATQTVYGYFYCHNNHLTSLDHAPQVFEKLISDFGDFISWNDVPEHVRLPPEIPPGNSAAGVRFPPP